MQKRSIPIFDRRRDPLMPPANAYQLDTPLDTLGRELRDLRISVTDQCNFRCTYCMPKAVFGNGYKFLPQTSLLTFEQITRLASAFKDIGVRKVRLTGGEPLLRRELEHLIEKLAEIGGLEIAMTTNGSLLERKARSLRMAGLDRLTVSLDALDEATFKSMNDVDFPLSVVLKGLDAAEAAGFGPLKINMVVKRGINEHAILPMVRRFRHSPHVVRFIEFMDVGATNGWMMDDVLPSADVISMINAEHPLESIDPNYRGEVAERWRFRDGAGEIGVISSVTHAFCGHCSRARLSPEGRLFTCLFGMAGFDMRPLLNSGAARAELAGRLAAIWSARSDRYSELRSSISGNGSRVEMSYIGG